MINFENYQAKLISMGIPKFRASQIFDAVFREGKTDYKLMSTLPRELQQTLAKKFPVLSLKPAQTLFSRDRKTVKVLFSLADGLKIEGVLLKFQDGRNSVCVSSQVGCQMGCVFCATGKMKFGRNLTGEEIADQVLYFSTCWPETNLQSKKLPTSFIWAWANRL